MPLLIADTAIPVQDQIRDAFSAIGIIREYNVIFVSLVVDRGWKTDFLIVK